MKIFITMQDLQQLDLQDPAYAVVKQHLHRMADMYPEDGYLVLAEKGDTDQSLALPELKLSWLDIVRLSEGCIKRDGHFFLTYLTNNAFGIDVILPAAAWLDAELRKALEEAAEPRK